MPIRNLSHVPTGWLTSLVLGALLCALPLSAQTWAPQVPPSSKGWPAAPAYPYEDPEQVRAQAQRLSDLMTERIRQWAVGQASNFYPDTVYQAVDQEQIGKVYLVKADDTLWSRRWGIREAKPVDFDSLTNSYPEVNATYLLAPILAPFGAKIHVTGEFPHCRFFDFQISPPLDPRFYVFGRYNGSPEISLADADIDPLPGHVNPFRIGADRTARNRGYHVTFDLAMGDAVQLNPGHKPPHFRAQGNRRTGSGFQYQGPWGIPKAAEFPAHGRARWDYALLWVRYYAMDKGKDGLGGVPLPKIWIELPTGEKFWPQTFLPWFEGVVNQTRKATVTAPAEPDAFSGPTIGWKKQYGVALNGFEEFYRQWKWDSPTDKAHIRRLELGMTGRGEDQPSLGGYEGSATLCTYNTFMGRPMSLGAGKVIVLTGRMPTFPDTRGGAARMTSGQVRFWSMTTYDSDIFTVPAGVALSAVMDDEVVLDSNRRYTIVYSRAQDRPANATAQAGVTWVDWGPTAQQGFIWRWMAIGPEWSMPDTTPNEVNLPRSKTAWSGTKYDSSLIGTNGHQGYMGWYQPQIHYMAKSTFEALGSKVDPTRVPPWNSGGSTLARPKARNGVYQSGPSIRFNRERGELVIRDIPPGSYLVELYSLLGGSMDKIETRPLRGKGEVTMALDFRRPGYYLARIIPVGGSGQPIKFFPFVL